MWDFVGIFALMFAIIVCTTLASIPKKKVTKKRDNYPNDAVLN